MIPEKVMNAVYQQMNPLILEMSKYNLSPDECVVMEFETAVVRIEFKH